jgi:phage-related protein
MAAGDLITQVWQAERDGLLIGDGTDYDIRVIDGLASMPEVRPQDRPLLLRHGSIAGDDYLGERIMTMELDIAESDRDLMATKIDALATAFRTTVEESPFHFRIPGVAGGSKAFINARVRRRDIPIGVEYSRGLATVAFEFHATDPRVYAAAESSDTVGLASTGGGLVFPATFNLSFGAVSSGGDLTVTNAGAFPAPAVFRIDGPCTSPIIENTTVGRSLSFDITLSASEFLVIDTEARTVLLGGTASRYSTLETSSRWYDLEPGDNALDFRASTTTAATLTVTWRSAWA